jgi:hypothetical protein
MQGCPFIEEASYKLLSEIVHCAGDKDDARKDGIGETSSTATPAIGITEDVSTTPSFLASSLSSAQRRVSISSL